MQEYNTLQDRLFAFRNVNDKGIYFVKNSEKEDYMSYAEIYEKAMNLLGGLQNNKFQKNDHVILQMENNDCFVISFWAVILGGGIPVPIDIAKSTQHQDKLLNVYNTLGNAYVLIEQDGAQGVKAFLELNLDTVEEGKLLGFSDLVTCGGEGEIRKTEPEDVAFIQFSSGSTGSPKGVVLTNENFSANIVDILDAACYTPNDILLGWVPLTHDLGLISMLSILYVEQDYVNIPTNLFIRNPLIWLTKMSEHRATISMSPNFGYHYTLKAMSETENYDWDLSSVRLIYNGAEPISVENCTAFLNELKQYSLPETALFTVYGMAEAVVAITFPKPASQLQYLRVDRDKLQIGKSIEIFDESNEHALEVVRVGKPIGEIQLGIRDLDGKELPEKFVGQIHVTGKNITKGYFGGNNKDAFDNNGWLKTGDLGFMDKGALYITGRLKELIIVNGQNFYPHDIEDRICKLLDLPVGRVVASSLMNNEGEELLIFVQYRKKLDSFIEIAGKITEIIALLTGGQNCAVIPVKRIPKTTSGKIQRSFLKKSFVNGEFDEAVNYLKENVQHEVLDVDLSQEEMFERLTAFLKVEVAEMIAEKTIEINQPLIDFGLTSKHMVMLQAKLSKYCDKQISVEVIFAYPTIEKLAYHLAHKELQASTDSLLIEISGMTDDEIAELL